MAGVMSADERLRVIHWSIWFFGITQWGFDLAIVMAVLAK
jgi:hypothetical protein